MKNQTLYTDRFSSVSSLVVTSKLQFLHLNPERSILRLCGMEIRVGDKVRVRVDVSENQDIKHRDDVRGEGDESEF